MPAREAPAPRALPGELAPRLGSLPERKVLGVALMRVRCIADALDQGGKLVARELAIVWKAVHIEVDCAARAIGQAAFKQAGDDLNHLGDMLGCAGEYMGWEDIERPLILEKRLRVEGGDLGRAAALLAGLGDQLILA